MSETAVRRDQLMASLPVPWPEPLLDQIQQRIEATGRRFVVLDDDPTGGQTLHGMPVLTRWSVDLLARELEQSTSFFVLTNTRALSRGEAEASVQEIGSNLVEASRRSGRAFAAGARGDSTLRGHFPLEAETIADVVTTDPGERPVHIMAPFFAEGGRFTIGDVQYVLQGDDLVPAAQTEFARDPSFGYTTSHLPSWIEEKTHGRVPAASVAAIGIEDLRSGGPFVVAQKLRAAAPGTLVVVNAADYRDLEVFVAGLLEAEASGKHFVCSTASSFVRVRAGIAPRELLSAPEVYDSASSSGGLLVVASYVDRSSEQLEAVLRLPGVAGVELRVDALLSSAAAEQARASREVDALLASGRDVVLYTSRGLRAGTSPDHAASIGLRIRQAVCGAIEVLTVRPRYLVVKGGSTASDVATSALKVQRAVVAGQLLPGVPVWLLGPESKYPGLRYVIFPGNVGGPESVADVLRGFARD